MAFTYVGYIDGHIDRSNEILNFFEATKLEKCGNKYDLLHPDNNYNLTVARFEKANDTSSSATDSSYCTFQEYVEQAPRVQAMSTPGGFADPRHFAKEKLLKSNILQLHFFIDHTVNANTMKTIFSGYVGRNKLTDWESLIQPAKTAALGPLFLKAIQAVLFVMGNNVWLDLTEEQRSSAAFRVRQVWAKFLAPANVQWLCSHIQHVAAIETIFNTKTPLRLPAGKTIQQLRGVFQNNCVFALEEAFRAVDKKPAKDPATGFPVDMKCLYAKWAAIKFSKNFKTRDVFGLEEILCVNTIQKPARKAVSLEEVQDEFDEDVELEDFPAERLF